MTPRSRPRGARPNWEPTTPRQHALATDILTQLASLRDIDELPRSGRGLFYDLRPDGHGNGVKYIKLGPGQKLKEKNDAARAAGDEIGYADPDAVGEILQLMRRTEVAAWAVDEDEIDDDHAQALLYPPSSTESAQAEIDYITEEVDNVRLDRQTGQAQRIEIWCEASGLGGRMERIAEPYGITVVPSGGQGGLKGQRQAAQRAANTVRAGMPMVVLQVGDYDKGGWNIFYSHAEAAAAWASDVVGGTWERGDEVVTLVDDDGEAMFTAKRIAITQAQVDAGTVELDEFGKAEAEQLGAVLSGLVRDAIDELVDEEVMQQVIDDEEAMRSEVRDELVRRWAS